MMIVTVICGFCAGYLLISPGVAQPRSERVNQVAAARRRFRRRSCASADPVMHSVLATYVVASALDSGASAHRAVTVLAQTCERVAKLTDTTCAEVEQLATISGEALGTGRWVSPPGSEWGIVCRALTLSRETGCAAADVMRSALATQRQRDARQHEKSSAALGVLIVLPLGLCALPAFMAWTVVPMAVAVFTATR